MRPTADLPLRSAPAPVQVHLWVRPARPVDPAALPVEVRRRWEATSPEDRSRFGTGVLTQLEALQDLAGQPVSLRRRCSACGADDHGRVRPGPPVSHWGLSVSHSGDLVLVAVVPTAGVAVGVDLERVRVRPARVGRRLFGEVVPSPADVAVLWTRKEAVLKALGTGIRGDLLSGLDVGPTDAPARLRVLGGQPELGPLVRGPATLIDVDPGDHRYRAALAVIGAARVEIVEGPPVRTGGR